MANECLRILLIKKGTDEVRHEADVPGRLAFAQWLMHQEQTLRQMGKDWLLEVIEIPESSVVGEKWWDGVRP
jgi:hypothetical protein